MAGLISLENVGVIYHGVRRIGSKGYWALEEANLEVQEGEILGLIGHNGAGKSTLLRVIAGILQPDRGHVIHVRPLRIQLLALGLGFVPHLSGRDNAVLSGMLLGNARRDIERALPAIREYSELGEFFEQPLSCYSSGMVMRLGFSVAMQSEPDVLLIDEVLGVGDADFLEKSSADLRSKMRSGMTCILVSHSDGTIRRYCDRVAWIEHGRTLGAGPVEDMLQRYHSTSNPGQ